ncbi:hypothetical protein HanLR1_Chr10g0370641 [Helianthus annuus]|nr:hypothetical protein HanLR1_Chr10g0370641 [Helianthus annuus]
MRDFAKKKKKKKKKKQDLIGLYVVKSIHWKLLSLVLQLRKLEIFHLHPCGGSYQ